MNDEPNKRKKKKKIKSKYPLPHSKISLDSQIGILKAYVVTSERGENPVSYRDVGKIAKINADDISKCNKFFCDVGFIRKIDRKYLPTKCTVEFYNTSQFDLDRAKDFLREEIEKSWFGLLTKKLMEYRESVNENELISKLGIEAEATKKDKLALKKVIEYMEFVKFIRKIPESNDYELKEKIEIPIEEKEVDKEIKKAEKVPISKKEIEKHYKYTITFNITITPETTKEDIEKMVKLVEEFIEEKTGEE